MALSPAGAIEKTSAVSTLIIGRVGGTHGDESDVAYLAGEQEDQTAQQEDEKKTLLVHGPNIVIAPDNVGAMLAEVDGNRTRRTGNTRPARFEGGGAHQALGHLQRETYRQP